MKVEVYDHLEELVAEFEVESLEDLIYDDYADGYHEFVVDGKRYKIETQKALKETE